MDKELIAHRFTKATHKYAREAVVQQHIAQRMANMIADFGYGNRHASEGRHSVNKIYEVGCGTGNLSRHLLTLFSPDEVIFNDLCPSMGEYVSDVLACHPPIKSSFLAGDAEAIQMPSAVDLVASCSAFQWFVALDEFIKRAHRSLNEHGLFAFSTFGPSNMSEIKALTGQGLHYYTFDSYQKMLSPYFEILHLEEEIYTPLFKNPMEVLKHLQRTGVTGTSQFVWTPGKLRTFIKEYSDNFTADSGEVRLTYHPIYVVARKK